MFIVNNEGNNGIWKTKILHDGLDNNFKLFIKFCIVHEVNSLFEKGVQISEKSYKSFKRWIFLNNKTVI